MADIKLLDCTLRDGGYVNDWQWGFGQARRIIQTLTRAGVDVVEVGFLRNVDGYDPDVTVCNTIEELNRLLPDESQRGRTMYSGMAMRSNYDIEKLSPYDGHGIEIIRITAHDYDIKDGMDFAREVKARGYKLSINPINIMGYSDKELLWIFEQVNAIHPWQFSIVDTFGSMRRRDLERIVSMADHNLAPDIRLALHLHENMALSFCLAQEFLDKHLRRDLAVDGSLMGMGRIPGNLPIELIADYMNEYFGSHYNIDDLMDAIQDHIAKTIIGRDVDELEPLLQSVQKCIVGNSSAKAAVDIALHDLVGQLMGQPWYRIWGLNAAKAPDTTFTIGIDTPDVVREKTKECAGQFNILKVKVGLDNDKEMIETIREITDLPLAVDANQGWKDREKALEMIHWLKEHGVVMVEQPMPKEMLDDNAWLTERSPLPTFADEAIQRLTDVQRVKGAYSGINIKLMKCTGMREAWKMLNYARAEGMKVMVGCMTETSCAVTAAAQLSPAVDFADLDGNLLIANDRFEGMTVVNGKITLPDRPGLGLKLL